MSNDGAGAGAQFADEVDANIEAEQSAIGAMLLSAEQIDPVLALAPPAAYYRPAHQLVAEAIASLHAEGTPVDAITVAQRMTVRGTLTRVGGAPYLHTLVASTPTAANATYYAKLVGEAYARRRLMNEFVRGLQILRNPGDITAAELRDRVMEALSGLDVTASLGVEGLEPALAEALNAIDEASRGSGLQGPSTGSPDLDRLIGGLAPGRVIVVGARPGVGKSVTALDLAREVAINQRLPVLFASIEMRRVDLVTRLLAAESKVNLQALLTGTVTDDQFSRLVTRTVEIQDAPLYIDDTTRSMSGIRAQAVRIAKEFGQPLALIVIDYIQIADYEGRAENRQLEITAMSKAVRAMSKDLNVCVVVLSQLKRIDNEDRVPLLTDLRESGSLEQDASQVILLFRPDTNDAEHARAGEIDYILAKNRFGPNGITLTRAWQGHLSRVRDMARASDSSSIL